MAAGPLPSTLLLPSPHAPPPPPSPSLWTLSEDGCLRLADQGDSPATSLTYHRQLNVIVVVTRESRVKVLDVCAGVQLQSSALCAPASSKCPVQCMYVPGHGGKVLFTDGRAVGMRGHHHGVLLLDTVLQTSVSSGNDVVRLELPLSEALQVLRSLQETDVLNSDQTEEVRRELETKICKCQAQTMGNHKVTKWSTVCLELSHGLLRSVFAALVAELKRLNRSVPSLSIASAVSERLNYLLPSPVPTEVGGSAPVERSLMFSEAARLETFSKWPHMNYKWALPDQMSQAGFYHQSSSTGDDRAMCFTCSICLMCWEPTDEPWSEHERHSPSCPFVKGEYTQNVPMSVTYAFSPAVLHSDRLEPFSCLGPSSCPGLAATASESGDVVIWNVSRSLKKEFHFTINPRDPLIKAATSLRQRRYGSDQELDSSVEEGAASSASNVAPIDESILSALEPNEVELLMSQRFKDDMAVTAVAIAGFAEPLQDFDGYVAYQGPSSKMPATNLDKPPAPLSGWVGSRPSLVAGVTIADPHHRAGSDSSAAEQIQLVRVMNDVNQTSSGTTSHALDIMKMDLEPETGSAEESPVAEGGAAAAPPAPSLPAPFLSSSTVSGVRNSGARPSSVGLYLVQYALGWQPPTAMGEGGASAPVTTAASKLGGSTSTGSQRDNGSSSLYKSAAHKNLLSYDQLMAPYGLNPFAAPSSLVQVNLDLTLEQTIEEAMMSVGFHSGGSDDGLTDGSSPKYHLPLGHSYPNSHNHPNHHGQLSVQQRTDQVDSSTGAAGEVERGERETGGVGGARTSRVVKCVPIPGGFGGDAHRVSHVLPTPDGWHVLVVVGPQEGGTTSDPPTPRGHWGAILIYRLGWVGGDLLLGDAPVLQRALVEREDVVTAVTLLPAELGDETGAARRPAASCGQTVSSTPTTPQQQQECLPRGHAALICVSGSVRLLDLTCLEMVGEMKPPPFTNFVAATYCSSIDRLCACTSDGNLLLLQLTCNDKCSPSITDRAEGARPFGLFSKPRTHTTKGFSTDFHEDDASNSQESSVDLLVKQPLTLDALTALHELTQFVDLTPRFSSTVPACWTEIQQEQKQRRHPQHLQQQGEANHHTRSWRLQTDSTTWDEHLLEITLPRSCCVGHIDIKFNLQPVFTTPPNIQVTLLKQNTSGMGKKDARFPDASPPKSSAQSDTSAPGTSYQPDAAESDDYENPVLRPSFQAAHNAVVVCGPLSLAAYIDLSGHGGVVTLTSPELMRTSARTFLVHLKTLGREDTANGSAKEQAQCNARAANAAAAQSCRPPLRWQALMKMQDKHGPVPSLQSLLELYVPPGSAVELLAASAPNRKADSLRGCDLFHEISITVRASKTKNIRNERAQRMAMLDSIDFQERLVAAICSRQVISGDMTEEHQTNVALDILNWVAAIQCNSIGVNFGCSVFSVVQANLEALIKCCFLEAGRSVAHKCSRLIVQCLEYAKTSRTPNGMEMCLQEALLYWLPRIAECRTAGAMRWYFVLLNRVKCVEAGVVGRDCLTLLVATVRELDSRADPLHALLRSRFGLYRTPFELELFDVEAPAPPKPTSTPVTYAAVVGNGGGGGGGASNLNNNNNGVASATAAAVAAMGAIGGGAGGLGGVASASSSTHTGNQTGAAAAAAVAASLSEDGQCGSLAALAPPTQQLRGLLEVEPLHFICHAASDGTKLEKMDSGLSGSTSNPLSLSPNMTVYVPSANWTKQITNASHQCISALKDLKKTEEELIKALQQSHNMSNGVGPVSHPSAASTSATATSSSSAANTAGQPRGSSAGGATTGTGVTGVPVSPWQHFFQPLTQQALVIERMHSGARRFVVLDFGRMVLLTDLMIPACPDLVSLSIDMWCRGEEADGQRLVVSTDIWYRSLVMNDLLPPPVCRFLKITAIGRYGMTTTRCRIPMGAFYGHTTVPSWMQPPQQIGEGGPNDIPIDIANSTAQQQLQTNLQVLSLLLEDVHCRYSLACDKLRALLGPLLATDFPNAGHVQVFIQREQQPGRAPPDDERRVFAAYRDCVQLQQQFNLVAATMERLSRSALPAPPPPAAPRHVRTGLRHVCTDKLRVLSECLLVALLGMTYRLGSGAAGTAVAVPLASLQEDLDRPTCELLFRYLAVGGSGRFQAMANALLVRTCGLQRWWGAFVANMLVELYHSNQTAIFPQDRVFLLMVSCHDKGLLHNTMPSVLELLQKLLNPVINSDSFIQGSVDLQLVGWVLLFVSFYLDIAEGGAANGLVAAEEEAKAGSSKDKEIGPTNRWDFIQEEWAMLKNQANQIKTASRRLYRRKLQKRLMYHKQQLEDLEQVKKSYIPLKTYSALKNHFGARVAVDVDAAMQLVKKMIKQQPPVKHFKEGSQSRRTTGGASAHATDEPYPGAHHHHHGHHSQQQHPGGRDSGRENPSEGREPSLLLPRTQSLQVARGLVLLLLSMDYTCNVDMFLLACKVLAKIVTLARPAIGLGEIVSQSQLDQLLWRCIGQRGAVDSPSWGGPWAVHAITCLLQDILEGERLYPIIRRSSRERTPPDNNVMLDPMPSTSGAGSSDGGDFSSGSITIDADKNPMQFQNDANLVGLINLLDVDSDDTSSDELMIDSTAAFPLPTKYSPLILKKTNTPGTGGVVVVGGGSGLATNKPLCFTLGSGAPSGGIPPLLPPKDSLSTSPDLGSELLPVPTVSAAVDARLEMGVDVAAEMRLRTMTFVEADVFFNAFLYPITPPSDEVGSSVGAARPFHPEQISAPPPPLLSPLQFGSPPAVSSSSVDMLAICFDRLFQHARMPGVNLEALLQLWITLNEATADTSSANHILPLSCASASGILAALAWHSTLSLRTWYLAFKVLHMPLTLRSPCYEDPAGPASSVARTLASDTNLLPVLVKFLSGSGLERESGSKCSVGPTVSSAMCNLVVRLIHACRSLRTGSHTGVHLKEQLLRIVHLLVANNGPIREGRGPMDAQCHLVNVLLTMRFEGVSSALQLSVVETVAALAETHLHARRRVTCRSSTESDASDASCFGGILSVLPRADPSADPGAADANRSALVHALLALCIRLVTTPVADTAPPTTAAGHSSTSVGAAASATASSGASACTTSRPPNDHVPPFLPTLPFLPALLTDALKMKRRSSGSSRSRLGRVATSASGAGPSAAATPQPPQTDELKSASGGGAGLLPATCSHTHALSMSPKQQYIADEVLRHKPTVMYLLSSLSACSGSSVAMMLGPMGGGAAGSGASCDDEERFFLGEPVSVGDVVFQLLCSLNAKADNVDAVLQPILTFLSSGSTEMHSLDGRSSVATSLSEPLLWFVMRILDCETSVAQFLALGGIQVICNNLVSSHLMQVNGHPSLLSVIMQKVNSLMAPTGKGQWPNLDRVDGLVNFAPLGAISLKDPTIHPADILIQPTPPHRRARTPAWSYHFYPEEAWVDLTITLPCAILLQEVHVQPHLASLATCPSAVSLEISADGLSLPQPVCPPRPTGGLTFVRLQLQRPEIATVVTVRLYKPRDSSNLGLSQILLLGSSAFGEAVARLRGSAGVPSEEAVARSSVGWLRLLHHCLTLPCAADTLRGMCASAAAVPGVLKTCCSLLLTPTPTLTYTTHIELVLLHLGRHSAPVGLQIINVLLQMCSSPFGQGNWCHVVNRPQSNWTTMDAVMDIVYLLCTTKDANTMERISALLEWLCNAARKALNQPEDPTSLGIPYGLYANITLGTEEPHGVAAQTFIHCIAAILWALNDAGLGAELEELLDIDVLKLIYRWTTGPSKSNTRRAAFAVLSAMCYVVPAHFVMLSEWMGLGAARRPPQEERPLPYEMLNEREEDERRYRQAPITDDSKESGGGSGANARHQPSQGSRGRRSRRRRRRHTPDWEMREFVMLVLDVGHLSSLAAASQSPTAVRRLIDCGLPATLATAILGFCIQQGSKVGPHSSNSDSCHADTMTDADKAGHFTTYDEDDQRFEVTGDQVASILNFFTEVCSEGSMRDWLGSAEGSIFWQPLLDLLCLPLSHSPLLHSQAAAFSASSACTTSPVTGVPCLSTQERAAMEVATIQFLAKCSWCHPLNQQLLAQVLCEVIGKQVTLSQGGFGMLHSISGFARRLIIQLLLENDKILIFIKSHLGLWNSHQVASGNRAQHPRFGCGHRFRLLYASTQMTCADIVKCVLGDSGAFPLGSVADVKDNNNPDSSSSGGGWGASGGGSGGVGVGSSGWGSGKLGAAGSGLGTVGSMEWVDYLSVAAGVLAKDKRHKEQSGVSSSAKLPAAPPGVARDQQHQPASTSGSASMLGSLAFSSLELSHELLPHQPLPEQMTVAQLLTMLQERGHQMGCPHIVLTLQQGHRNRNEATDSIGRISSEVLLGCQSFPSALQVFAGVGGLALLAQYLPVLYPDIGRATTPAASGKANGGASGGAGAGGGGAEKTMNDLGSVVDADWVKVEAPDDIFDMPFQDFPELLHPGTSTPRSNRNGQLPPSVPPHSLAAFGLFLRLPGYAETLLKERQKAQCLLRLSLGVTDDGEGGDILSSPIASSLPTLPFQVIQLLFNSTPLSTDDGVLLRRMALDVGAIHLVLGCLSVLSHQNVEVPMLGIHPEMILSGGHVTPSQETPAASAASTSTAAAAAAAVAGRSDDKSHLYWAKGTGFGTGSTTQSWDVEQAILRQRSEEEHVTCLLLVLASYINPRGSHAGRGHGFFGGANDDYDDDEEVWAAELSDEDEDDDTDEGEAGRVASAGDGAPMPLPLLPAVFPELLAQSCVFATISSYLRNDSVLDMARHVPLYRALLKLLRAMAISSQLVGLLLPSPGSRRSGAGGSGSSALSVCCLLTKMKLCVDTYASRLRSNRSRGGKSGGGSSVTGLAGGSSGGSSKGPGPPLLKTKEEEDESEGLALLIPDIQETARIVKKATERLVVADDDEEDGHDDERCDGSVGQHRAGTTLGDLVMERRLLQKSTEDRYVEIMRRLQFDTFEMIVEDDDGTRFTVSHHFESNMRAAGDHGHPARSRRLAQETVTLSTSLPLSYSSSVFVRCDQDRLDLMKVLITGPADTPYANGCFEFDVYFPPDYPNSPMLINLETTGHHTVRFNPNLYNDGKVCLSILNTWHGRPEEKWNPQTSSFLQVLVSIQSLILVGEPYFNEPGYERSRGTPSGQQSSREYDSNIQQATVKWAMLEQLRSTCSCFKEVIQRHFWIKRAEIVKQCQGWINDMEAQGSDRRTGRTVALNCQALKRHFAQLNEEFARLKPPPGLEDLAENMDWAGLVPAAAAATPAASSHCNTDAGEVTGRTEALVAELVQLTTSTTSSKDDDEEEEEDSQSPPTVPATPPPPPPPPPPTSQGEGEASHTQAATASSSSSLLFCGPV